MKDMEIEQVGYLDDFAASSCGPVCDCDGACGAEPVCGLETIHAAEPICGLEVTSGCGSEGIFEASCGIEDCSDCNPGYGIEPSVQSTYGHQGEVIYSTTGEPYGTAAPCDAGCACDACAPACEMDRYPLFLPILRVNWCRFDFFAGTQAFTGPMNYASLTGDPSGPRNGSGSFGFYEGFNEGRSLKRWLGVDLAMQFGLRATQNNLSGAEFSDETRHQIFLTGGFFRRVDYGLQYGLVVDYLNEDWYYQGDLTQLRGEFSWRLRSCDEAGFQFTSDLGSDTSVTTVRDATGAAVRTTTTFEATDQYRLFYRWNLRNRGVWSAFAGWTDQSHGLLGTLLDLRLSPRVGMQTGVTYLIPDRDLDVNEHREEAWNLSLGLVFRPGGMKGADRYSRPLFGVADNGTFIVRRQ